jgi:intracellular sulfur oxidation DsrE/DsrF family protein
MFFKAFMKFAALAVILAFASGCATLTGAKPGVVIQMSDNDPAKWNLALNNAKNVQQEMGKDKVDIEIVAYGPGINMLKFDSEVANRVTEAEKSGIAIRACGNTMKAMKLTDKDLNPSAKVVPAGVIEIMTKQEAGWTYIKP